MKEEGKGGRESREGGREGGRRRRMGVGKRRREGMEKRGRTGVVAVQYTTELTTSLEISTQNEHTHAQN